MAGLWLAAALGTCGQASAQGVDSGLEVRVNPYAARAGSGTLLYPGGQYARNVPPLLYPGEGGGPIRLHPAGKRRIVRDAVVTPRIAKPKPQQLASAAPPPPVAKPAPQPQASAPASNPYLGAPNLSNVLSGAPAGKPAAKPAPAPPQGNSEAGLTKRSVILFAKDASDPAEGALGAIKFLAGDLNAAMNGPSARVELQAFGGAKGDKGSDARRLSLKRALSIRQILIDDGVSAGRIDVRAMGGTDDTGPADRVDVFVKA